MESYAAVTVEKNVKKYEIKHRWLKKRGIFDTIVRIGRKETGELAWKTE